MFRVTPKPLAAVARKPAIIGFFLIAITVLLYRQAFFPETAPADIANLLEASLFDPEGATPPFALGVFACLLFYRRQALAAAIGAGASHWLSGLCLIASVALLCWSDLIGAPDFGRLSFVFAILGAGYWLGGRQLVGVLGLPLLAILLSVAPPLAVTNQILLPLQLATGKLASVMLSMLGEQHDLLGDQIWKGNLIFHVIEGCSGFRSIFTLLLAAVLYAGLVCHRSIETLSLLILAPVVAFATNGIRVVVLIMRELPSDASEHAVQGVLMIVLGVLLLAAIENFVFPLFFSRLRAGEEDSPSKAENPTCASAGKSVDNRLAWLLLLAISYLVVTVVSPRVFALTPPIDRLNVEAVGVSDDGWSVKELRRNADFLGSTRFRHLTARAYSRESTRIGLFLAAEDRRARNRFGWSPKTAIPGPGWLGIEDLQPWRVGDHIVERRVVHYPRRSLLVFHWRDGYRSWGEELLRNWLSLDHTTWRVVGPSLVIRLVTEVTDSASDLERADRSLRRFAEHLQTDIDVRVAKEIARTVK